MSLEARKQVGEAIAPLSFLQTLVFKPNFFYVYTVLKVLMESIHSSQHNKHWLLYNSQMIESFQSLKCSHAHLLYL